MDVEQQAGNIATKTKQSKHGTGELTIAEKEYIERWALKPIFDERYHTAFIQQKTRENPAYWHGVCAGVNWGLNTIIDAQTADVVEVVHGEWEEKEGEEHIERIFVCSVCRIFHAWGEAEKYNYCPHCGAKMDGERKERNQ